MPSLKDLKNRIESVKSTRKITKAMQMVAAAKLRRAQDAAEMARPYAERFNAVMGGLASRRGQSEARRASGGHRQGPGAPAGGDDRRARPLRWLQLVHRQAARQRIDSLKAKGKTVKILTVGKKGREQLKRDYADLFVGHVDLSASSASAMPTPQRSQRSAGRFDAGEFDVATIFFAKFQNVISQIPTATAGDPGAFDAAERRPSTPARSTTTSRPKRRSWPTFCRAVWRRRSLPRCWKTAPPNRARGCPRWTTRPATRAR
jgi:F-type H+-transporting ATPase subunit gamma